MSFQSPNISSLQPGAPVASARPARAHPAAAAETESDSVTVDTMPAGPPPEVLDAIGAASKAYDRLVATGVQLHFDVDEQTGRVAVHILDLQGMVVGNLAPSQVLDIATGGTLP